MRVKSYDFCDEEGFKRAMERLDRVFRWGKSELAELIQHENDHYAKAKELGYHPSYRIKISIGYVEGMLVESAQPVTVIPGIRKEDIAKIVSAVKDPSRGDEAILRKLGRER